MSAVTPVQASFPQTNSERIEVVLDVSELPDDRKVPPPKYRHAAWPWMDLNKVITDVPLVCHDTPALEPWSRYPQSHFANWTPNQVNRCGMLAICQKERECQIHKVDILANGVFMIPREARSCCIPLVPASARKFWDELQEPFDPNLRARALFIEDITLNALRILGTSYNIEPFFFASSANWIPSRYQEDLRDGEGDHITVVLPFIRVVKHKEERIRPAPSDERRDSPEQRPSHFTDKGQVIDTQTPLVLSDKSALLPDLLAIHMVRNVEGNVIISYHHHLKLQKMTAGRLRSLVQRTGDSVYWSKIYASSRDPTFVSLAMLWYVLYAWDEVFKVLYAHLTEHLESTNVMTRHKEETDEMKHLKHIRELHKVQAHLLCYQQLLRDFRKSVEFIRDTPNPAMDQDSITDDEREGSNKLMKQESKNLLSEIERLEKQRWIQSGRLRNAIKLAFSTVSIGDSKDMRMLTRATLRDSVAKRRISYLGMVFLPATYLASVFGMNVKELNKTPGSPEMVVYIWSTIVLTAITMWAVIALQKPSSFHRDDIVERIAWPIFFVCRLMGWLTRANKGDRSTNSSRSTDTGRKTLRKI